MGLIFLIIFFLGIIIFISKYAGSFKNSNQGKTYIDNNGYRRFTDSNKLVHRYVMEKKLGRKLRQGEIVHHKNRNKLDNSFENLEVFSSQAEHERHHNQTDWLFTLSREMARRFRFKIW